MCEHHKTTGKVNTEHDREHSQWSRRSFVQTLGFAGAGSMLLGSNILRASAVSPLAVALNKADSDRILVLIRLQGGNDGLNTIVPVLQYDDYANFRPTLYHRQNQLISLNDDFAIPNYMSAFESMWGEGKMKVVHGVGYENQSFSHFTSSDIWAATQRTEEYEDGFMGRHFTEQYPDYLLSPPVKPLAIQIGSIGNLIFDDSDISYSFLVSNPDQLQQIAENGVQFNLDNIDKTCHSGMQKEFLRQQANATYAYSAVIHDAYTRSTNGVEYEDNRIAQQLAIVARLIKGNLGTKVFMVTLNGFDTHVGQADRHSTLMRELSNGVKHFFDDLNQTGHDQNVLGMTFSEFGRRVMENGSQGTDHGAASTMMFFGPGLEGNGFVGEHPDITDIGRNGNLNYTTDFRGLYATVLSQWMCLDVGQVENALVGNYDNLDLGFACTAASDPEPTDPDDTTQPTDPTEPIDPIAEENPNPPAPIESFSHVPFYNANGPSISITAHKAMHLDVQLYNMLGQSMGSIFNDFVDGGTHEIVIKDHLGLDAMASGQYIYRITNFEGASSKLIVIE